LNDAVLAGRLKPEERNGLLATMDKEVGDLVLKNNYEQTQILAAMLAQKTDIQGTYTRLLCELEREANLSREIEVLPTDKEIRTRLANGQGLISSELSVLMAYAKSIVKVELGNSPLWKEPYFQKKYLTAEFPAELQKRFYDLMPKHRLARDIVITQLTNTMMHRMGITFVHLLYDETGASTAMIARAFSVNYEVLELEKVWHEIDKLDGKVDASVQSEMINELGRLMCRLSRWLLCRHRSGIDVEGLVATLSPKFQVVRDLLPKMLYKQDMEQKNELRSRLISAGVPKVLADKFSDVMVVSFVYDIVEAAERNNLDLVEATEVYLALNEEMSFAWMRAAIINARGHSYWDVLSSSALRDDLDKLQRIVTATIMQNTSSKLSVKARIATWCEDYRFLVNRWRYMVEDIKVSQKEYVRYSVALRCLLDLAQASMYGAKNYTQKNNEIL
jgi:glutamate dehydrogenase